MIEFRALGPIDLRSDDGRSIRSVLAQNKRLALLARLTLIRPGDFCRRDRLLGLFWPESEESRARNSLNQAIFQLRRSLGEGVIVTRGPEEVGLDAERLWCDVIAFEEAVDRRDPAEAVGLYRGPLLEGLEDVADAPEWGHWLDGERARLRKMFVDALGALARGKEAAGDVAGASAAWERLAEEAPFDAEVALQRMRSLAERGNRVVALELERDFQQRLREEFGAAPDPALRAFAQRLTAEPPPPAELGGAIADSRVEERLASAGPAAAAWPGAAPLAIPLPPTPLIGRATEVEAIHHTLVKDKARLVTLTGPGGVGKTRLSLEIARTFISDHSHDVAFVPLAQLTDPALVLPAIAGALRIRESGPLPLPDALREYLRSTAALLVLDNFEHVIDAVPEIAALLAAAPRLKVLATSRSALRLSAEHEFPVSPLAVPQPGPATNGKDLLGYGAVELFVARAKSMDPEFELMPENAAAVVEICAGLDGLPLAIELAAARTRVLSPTSMVARLRKRLQWLTGGARDLPTRHQTLRSTIDWSYELLTEGERRLFRGLAAFRGGSRLEAIESVCGRAEDGKQDVLDRLESLVAQSLVARAPAPDGDVRFLMLETVREYARERLDENAAEAEAVLRQHAAYHLELAERAEPRLVGAEQARLLARLEEEHDNFRAVLERSGELGEAGTILRLAGALWRFWWMRGHLSEGRRWTEEALRLSGDGGESATRFRGRALLAASALALYQGDLRIARSRGEDALQIFEKLGDQDGVATALSRLGQQAWKQGEFARARTNCERSLAIHRELGHSRAVAGLLFSLGCLETDQGHYDEARQFYAECLSLNAELEDPELNSSVLLNLGMIAYRLGDLAVARGWLERGIEIARAVGSKQHLAGALNTLGMVARDLGDLQTARSHLEESYTLQEELGDRVGHAHLAHSLGSLALRAQEHELAERMLIQSLRAFGDLGLRPPVECLADLGELALEQGQLERAIRLLGTASRLSEQPGTGMTTSDRERLAKVLIEAETRAGKAVWRREWKEIQSIELADAIQKIFDQQPLALSARSP